MAYLQNNQQENEDQMNTMTPQGQAQSQVTQTAQTEAGTPGQSAFVDSGNVQTNQAAPAPTQPKKNVGSGTFTNVKKYIQANQPQASKIAGAVTQNIGQEAQKVGQAVQQKEQQYQQNIAQNQARLNQAQNFTQQTLQAAGTQGVAPAESDIQRFQALLSGQERFTPSGELNTSAQEARAQQLARLTGQAERAAGGSELLRQTFGKNQYTRGQQALDNLILSGDQSARQSLVQGTQQATDQLGKQIRDARQAALAKAAGLGQQATQFRTQLGEQLAGARQQVEADIESEVQRRRAELQAEQQAFQQALQSGTVTEEQLRKYLDQSQLDKAAQDFEQRKQQTLALLGGRELEELRRQGEQTGDYSAYQDALQRQSDLTISGPLSAEEQFISREQFFGPQQFDQSGQALNQDLNAYITTNRALAELQRRQGGDFGLTREQINQIVQQAQQGQIQGATPASTGVFSGQNQTAANIRELVAQQLRSQTRTAQSYIDEFLQRQAQGRMDLGDLASFVNPEEITRQVAVTDEQIARQNALAALAGQQGTGIQSSDRRAAPATPGQYNLLEALRRLRG